MAVRISSCLHLAMIFSLAACAGEAATNEIGWVDDSGISPKADSSKADSPADMTTHETTTADSSPDDNVPLDTSTTEVNSGIDASVDTSPIDSSTPDSQSMPDSTPDASSSVCALRPTCNAALPDFGPKRKWNSLIGPIGSAQHRGRDLFLLPGKEQWVLGKFGYNMTVVNPDKDLKGEEVDIYLLRDCKSTWTKIGTVTTTEDGQHPTVYGVEDTGGRAYLNLAKAGIAPLGVGKHRILMVVAGDHSYADQYIEVLPPNAKIVVTDVDGTLTSSEYAQVGSVVGLPPPEAHPGAADMMNAFARRGYFIFYLTARPEWLMKWTRDWFPQRGFPPGLVHTTLSLTGAIGSSAVTYKTGELSMLKQLTGIVPSYGFGNKDSDRDAYKASGITMGNTYYYKLGADPMGGIDHSDYTKLVSMANGASYVCPM